MQDQFKFGEVFRFITPILVTISIFILGNMQYKIDKMDTHFTNHLQHHQDLEVGYEKRLSCMESRQRMILKKVFQDDGE